jgi:hypothetical protein
VYYNEIGGALCCEKERSNEKYEQSATGGIYIAVEKGKRKHNALYNQRSSAVPPVAIGCKRKRKHLGK